MMHCHTEDLHVDRLKRNSKNKIIHLGLTFYCLSYFLEFGENMFFKHKTQFFYEQSLMILQIPSNVLLFMYCT